MAKAVKAEASLSTLAKGKSKSKAKSVAIATTKEVQLQGMFMIGVWVVTVFILWLFSNPAASDAVFTKYPKLSVMYGATSVAFAFATALDVLAYINAVSDEKVSFEATIVAHPAAIDRPFCVTSECCLAYLPTSTVWPVFPT